MWVGMSKEVLQCEEWKNCLGILGAGEDRERLLAGRKLRNSNKLQLACLKNQNLDGSSEELRSICHEWRDCVSTETSGRNKLEELEALLEAANVSHISSASASP